MSSEEIKSIFGNGVRVRVMGVLVEGDQILLINHTGLNPENELWLPPGGGVEVGESVVDALRREFKEETQLDIDIGEFLGVNEFIDPPLHAIELIFFVNRISGTPVLGHDPEMSDGGILKSVRWIPVKELKLIGNSRLHSLLQDIDSIDRLFAKRGFFNLGNNP